LSLGHCREGRVVCGYHGLEVGGDGATAAMAGQDVSRIPSIRTFPVIERFGFIWLWPGKASEADADLIPSLTWANNPHWAYDGGVYHIASDYRLMVDNLMDLTHETFVHASSIGQNEIAEAPVETVLEDGEVITRRFMQAVTAPPFWQSALASAGLPTDLPVDRWQICRFSPPSHVMIEVGVALAGEGGRNAPLERKVAAVVVDFITPETETSHWYFWGMARQFVPENPALTEAIRVGQGRIFAEDLAVLEAQQENLSRRPDLRLLSLNIDAGGAQARAMIARQIRKESAFASG
jgi:vanillate O-demethylase monooxygenase subunit